MKPSSRLLGSFECLEDRSLPSSFGIPWPDASHLTLSLAPDGTRTPVGPSSLASLMNPVGLPGVWQREILRAFQTWAVNANINIGLVADGGQPLGTVGAVQDDGRFGDIRIGAAGTGSPEVASAGPFSWTGTTLAGDVLFNTDEPYAVGNVAGKYDVFSVAVHEAGHVFGLDHSTAADSVMQADYGYRTNLGTGDVANIQALYGTRSPDAFDAVCKNDTPATASVLLSQPAGVGNRYVANGDLTTLADADCYRITALPALTSVTVRLQAEELSLILPRVTVYDAAGRVVASGLTRDPFNNDLTLKFNTPLLGGSYVVRVEGATEDVFGIGGYRLTVDATLLGAQLPSLAPLLAPVVNLVDNTLQTATTLIGINPVQTDDAFDAVYRGVIQSPQDTHYYKIMAPLTSPGAPTNLNVLVWGLDAKPLNPRVHLYDAAGHPVPFQVLANDAGLMSVQIPNVTPGQFYYIQISARVPGDASSTGAFFLGADFNQNTPTTPDWVVGNTIAPSAAETSTLTVTEGGLYQFFLAANQASGTGGVVMTVTDAAGNLVAVLDSGSGQPPATGVRYLATGNYAVQYRSRSASPVQYNLLMLQMSDGIGPYATTTTKSDVSSGPGSGSSGSTSPSSGYTYSGSSSEPKPSSANYYYF